MALSRGFGDFEPIENLFTGVKNPRQEKGTIKVDMHQVQEVCLLRLEEFLS
jgi:hypothetical protein